MAFLSSPGQKIKPTVCLGSLLLEEAYVVNFMVDDVVILYREMFSK